MAAKVTPTQAKVLRFIAEHTAEKGYPPTLIEIARHIGARSPTAAMDHTKRLIRAELLTRGPKSVARTFKLTSKGQLLLATGDELRRIAGALG